MGEVQSPDEKAYLIKNSEGIWIDPSLFLSGKNAMVEVVVLNIEQYVEKKDLLMWKSPPIPYRNLDVSVIESGTERPRDHVMVFTRPAGRRPWWRRLASALSFRRQTPED